MEARLLGWLRDREAEMADLLSRLAIAESPSLVPGAECEALELVAEELRAAGFAVRFVHAGQGSHLYARPEDRSRGAPYQLVLGHVDTVWPLGTTAAMPPRVEHGRLYGPGVYDMKGGLVQLVFALRALHELGATPAVDPVVFVNSDEEVGSEGSVRWIRPLAAGAVRALVLEPPSSPDGSVKTARKGIGRYRVAVRGRAAHAGTSPEEGVSAIRELAHQVERLFELNDRDRGITVNVGTLDGGLRANVVAPEAHALVDVRVRDSDTAVELDRAVRAPGALPPGIAVTVDGGFGRPPMIATDRNRELARRAHVLGRRLGLDVGEAGQVGGGSDANFTSELTATLDGLGSVGDGAHAADEHVVVHSLAERAALLALMLLEPA
jgi:glutamate carboxypeptidase